MAIKARDPITPVDAAKQREALEFVTTKIFRDEPSNLAPKCCDDWLSRIGIIGVATPAPWAATASTSMTASSASSGLPWGIACRRTSCVACRTSRRWQRTTKMSSRMNEVFRAMTDSIWTELKPDSTESCCSIIRRNLQREHLSRLARIAVRPGVDLSRMFFVSFASDGGSYPADARSLARMHLKEINGLIESALQGEAKLDDSTRAHWEECRDQIKKVLDASIETSQP